MDVLGTDRADALREGLSDYAPLPIRIDDVVAEWVRLRAATIATGSPDDRERRQNDTWIAACALSVEPPLPVVTGNLRDFTVLAAAGRLRLVHPDRPQSTQPRRAELAAARRRVRPGSVAVDSGHHPRWVLRPLCRGAGSVTELG